MSLGHHKRNYGEAFSHWRRKPKENPSSGEVISKLEPGRPKFPTNWLLRDSLQRDGFQMFTVYPQNEHLDIYTKRSALAASPSVVGLQSHSGEGVIRQRSGFIVESDGTHSVIITSACLLNCSTTQNSEVDIKITVHIRDGRTFDGEVKAQDFLYNLAAIRIHTDALLPTISLAQLKDGITVNGVNPSVQVNEKSVLLRPQSSSFELIPGDSVIALGRFIQNSDLMAAPGVFSVDQCKYACKELFRASCRITECGIGGPLINRFGDAIGICLHAHSYTAFLPINIASTWWEHCKKYGQPHRPLLGMNVTNLYAVPVRIIEGIVQRFPDIVKGVIVEKVAPGSAAEFAGLKRNDLIIEFAGKRVHGVLELFENTWNKVGESVDLTVIRASVGAPLHFTMTVGEAICTPETAAAVGSSHAIKRI